jgi:hypothetical protein
MSPLSTRIAKLEIGTAPSAFDREMAARSGLPANLTAVLAHVAVHIAAVVNAGVRCLDPTPARRRLSLPPRSSGADPGRTRNPCGRLSRHCDNSPGRPGLI